MWATSGIVPVVDGAHGTGLVVGSGLVVQLAVQRVAVGGVGNHCRAVVGGAFGGDEAGAGKCVGSPGEGHADERVAEDVQLCRHKNCHKGTKVWSILQILYRVKTKGQKDKDNIISILGQNKIIFCPFCLFVSL